MPDTITNSMDLEITPTQAKDLLASSTPPLLLDVREPMEYQMARIEPSTNMPMGEVPARAHQELDEEQPILVLCHHGVRSLSVAAWLRSHDYDKAQSISGGIDAWSRLVDPSVPRY
jgi:rhodanese-related sulfurtransferase